MGKSGGAYFLQRGDEDFLSACLGICTWSFSGPKPDSSACPRRITNPTKEGNPRTTLRPKSKPSSLQTTGPILTWAAERATDSVKESLSAGSGTLHAFCDDALNHEPSTRISSPPLGPLRRTAVGRTLEHRSEPLNQPTDYD